MPDEKKVPPPDDDDDDEKPPSATDRWHNLVSEIDMHGVPRLETDIGKAKKIIWIVFMLFLLSVCCWQLYRVLALFLSLPTATTFEYVYGRELNFPAVTICNLNPFRTSRTGNLPDGPAKTFFETKKSQTTGNGGPQTPGGTFNWSNLDYSTQRTDYDTKQEFYAYFMSLPTAFQESVGYSMDDMLLDCSFNGLTCGTANFTRNAHPQFGNCFTFNTPLSDGSVQTVSAPGPLSGLSLIMDIVQDDYFHQVAESAGIKVLVHHQEVFPFAEESGVLVSPGMETQIGFEQITVLRAEYPYGNCKNYSTDEGMVRDAYMEELTGVNYTTIGCERTCFQKEIIKNCNCKYAMYVYKGTAFENTDAKTVDWCQLNQQTTRKCIEVLERKLHNGTLDCATNCPPRCIDVTYQSTVASSKWPARSKEPDLKHVIQTTNNALYNVINNKTAAEQTQFYNENLVKVSTFYRDMKYQYVVTSSAYTTEEMMSDFGGCIELYLGLSIITVMEVVEFVIDLCNICRRKRQMKKKTGPTKTP